MPHTLARALSLTLACVAILLSAGIAHAQHVIDTIQFGNHRSEQQHRLTPQLSETVSGLLDQPARQLLPGGTPDWIGGEIQFSMKVDPDQPNYITVKLSGDDHGEELGRLILYIDGKQVGQRHLGEVDILDIASKSPRYPGRFFYKTLPLPEAMTRGKTTVRLSIQVNGPIWGYGNTWDKFQKPLEHPSRTIYQAHTHTDAYFKPASDDVQGMPMTADQAPRRAQPGSEVIQQVVDVVNDEIRKQMRYPDTMRQVFIQFMANAYHTPWTDAYHRKDVLEKIVRGIDYRYEVWRENPDIIKSDRDTWNHDWFGHGPTADAVRLLNEELEPYLSENIKDTDIPRRTGWSDMFIASRDFHVTTRRQYTNQSMIKDLYGTYLCNRAVAILDPERAWSEQRALRYLYESIGLEPWRGSDDAHGNPTYPLGENYIQLTEAGLTKELGYVGNYGEVIDWATFIYEATKPRPDAEGDPRIKQQLIKLARARAAFRHPALDDEGNRAMRLETVVGWRDTKFPGDVVYDQRASWDGGPLDAAAATMDPVLIGYGKQMIEDNQFFKVIKDRLDSRNFRVIVGLMNVPGAYRAVLAAPDPGNRLPMAEGQPDYVFADPEAGVVAIRNGSDILYASLYWRARYAVNGLARVHYLTPAIERDATVRQTTVFERSGMTYTQPDRPNEAQTGRHDKNLFAQDIHLATAGQKQPIAKLPGGVQGFRPGRENVYAGKSDFYVMRYGAYLIAMNCTKEKSFRLDIPADFNGARNLTDSGHPRLQVSTMILEPWQTVVLYAP